MRPQDEWVFGLSLDDTIAWSLSPVYRTAHGLVVADEAERITEPVDLGGPVDGFVDIQAGLARALAEVRSRHRSEFDLVTAIGVSLVGLADRRRRELRSIALMRYGGDPGRSPVIAFKTLFRGLFRHVSTAGNPRINIHNESTAKALAEWTLRLPDESRSKSLFYVMFSEGVNAAFISDGQPIFAEMHSELGHMWPRPHRRDRNFNVVYSGCRIHKFCFEGLASTDRIVREWPGEGLASPEAQDVISFYVGQMCMNGVLAYSPEKIVLGGSNIREGMLDAIREYFAYFNSGDTGKPYVDYAAAQQADFISMATFRPEQAGVVAALELARRVVENPSHALKVTTQPYRQLG